MLHVLCLLTLLATLPLIAMGGLVTSYGAGLSVPDWPNSYGYNMFLFPPSMWIGGIFYEHTHRLLGTLVGLLAVASAFSAFAPARFPRFRRLAGWTTVVCFVLAGLATGAKFVFGTAPAGTDAGLLQKLLPHLSTGFASLGLFALAAWIARTPDPRRWVRWLTVLILVAVIVQGIKGGLRVEMVSIELAIAHGVFAQLILCLMAGACVVTSRWWWRSGVLARERSVAVLSPVRAVLASRGIAVLAIVTASLTVAQLVMGATMRHLDAGLAIPDLPLAYGRILPPTTPDQLAAANEFRLASGDLAIGAPTTLAKIWIHFSHRVGAVLVTAAVLALSWSVFRGARNRKDLLFLAWLLLPMIAAQVTLGLLTIYFRKPADLATAHHTLGALLLMTVVVLGIRATRVFATSPAVSPVLIPSEPRPHSSEQDRAKALVTA
jgi:cytochrome c oxidase assembly protein subunit 15